MNNACPYCKQPMKSATVIPVMRPRWMRIYRAVVEAGPEGISPDDLLVRMYDDDEWPTPAGAGILRTQICEINKIIKSLDQNITARPRRKYRLVSLR